MFLSWSNIGGKKKLIIFRLGIGNHGVIRLSFYCLKKRIKNKFRQFLRIFSASLGKNFLTCLHGTIGTWLLNLKYGRSFSFVSFQLHAITCDYTRFFTKIRGKVILLKTFYIANCKFINLNL